MRIHRSMRHKTPKHRQCCTRVGGSKRNFDGNLSNNSWTTRGHFAYPEPPVGLPYIPDLLPKLVNISIPSIQRPDRRLKPIITSPRRVSNQVSKTKWQRGVCSFSKIGIRDLDGTLNRILYQKQHESGMKAVPSRKSLPPAWPPRLPKS